MTLPDTAAASCSFHVLSRIRTHTQRYYNNVVYARPLTRTGTGRVLTSTSPHFSFPPIHVYKYYTGASCERNYTHILYLCTIICSWLNGQSFYPLFLRVNNASDLRCGGGIPLIRTVARRRFLRDRKQYI